MKRKRNIKIEDEERNVALELEACLDIASTGVTVDDQSCRSKLGNAVTYLAIAHLELNPLWPHQIRWLDGIEWSSLERSQVNSIEGKGTIWWGNRIEPETSLVGCGLQVYLQIVSRDHHQVKYALKFESDGVLYLVQN